MGSSALVTGNVAGRRSFDALVARLADSPTTLSERELLLASHWSLGEDARLREDPRFRETPWGRWMLAEDFVANEAIYRWLHTERRGSMPLRAALKRAADAFGRRCVFCADDPRFVLRNEDVHLAASELSHQPVIEDQVGDLEKYKTHLPLYSLKAAAAAEPAGQPLETLGWVRVTLPGRHLNDRMFIARIEGHGMDDGKSGLVDGGYAVFEWWPSGTTHLLNVLVRGAFRGPETGSYAVKKYVADPRAAEGRHRRVSLVSLNPDKERYPDIELDAEDAAAVTVVAKVVQSLSSDDYERRPKAKRRVGHRTLSGTEGLAEQATRLGRRVASFFDQTAPCDEDDDPNESTGGGWRTRLVCLDVEAGGPRLELGPLDGLPPFVKKLRVVGGAGWDGVLLVANARMRPARLPVRPGAGPWRWEAVGFEDEEDLGLERLALDALPTNTVSVFRVGADGVGQYQDSTTLALGQAYRILLPAGVGEPSLGVELGDGWRLWSLAPSAPLSATTRAALTTVGLDLGEAWPRLQWALLPPAAWRTNARGESYPVYEAGREIVVNVTGLAPDDGDTAMLFLHGPTGTERLALPRDGLVSLGAPAPGRWACALLHPLTAIQSTTLVFEVADNAGQRVEASWSASAPEGLTSLQITAPPGWPVKLVWRVLHETPLTTLYAGDDGTVDLDDARALVTARAQRTRIADLVVDFGELGRRALPHDGRASVDQVRESLTSLWQQRADLVRSRVGAWLTLLPAWFEPVTALFGYGLEPLPEEAFPTTDADAPHGLAAWRLTVDERILGSITRSPSRVLVLTTDLDGVMSTAREWVDRACTAAQVREALVTDGVRWTTHRKGNRLSRRMWNIGEAIDQRALDSMLADLAEGL